MAKGKIFIGEIMGDMVNALNTMESTMETGTTQQLAKIDEQIEGLQKVNTTVGMSILEGKVIPGENNVIVFNDTEMTSIGNNRITVGKAIAYALGEVSIEATIKGNDPGLYAGFYYKINDGSLVTVGTKQGNTWGKKSTNISVNVGDAIELLIGPQGVNVNVILQEKSCKMSYDLVNVANDGYLVKV